MPHLPSWRASALLPLIALALAASITTAGAQIGPTTYATRRIAVLAKLGTDVMIVPARGSFLADDQPGFVQAPDFQYLTGLDSQVGAVLVLDGRDQAVTLYVPRPSPLVSLDVIAPTARSAVELRMNEVASVDTLEARLRQRFAEQPTTVHISSSDARGAVLTPLPMAQSGVRWTAWVKSLGAANARPAVAILRSLREIKSADEITILRRVGAASGAAFLAGIRALRPGATQRSAEMAVVNACVARGGAQRVVLAVDHERAERTIPVTLFVIPVV